MLRDIMPAIAQPEDPMWTTNVMTRELGGVIRALMYAHYKRKRGEHPDANAYMGTARIELADLITQSRLLAEQMGWRWVELENDGVERFRERMKELAEGELD